MRAGERRQVEFQAALSRRHAALLAHRGLVEAGLRARLLSLLFELLQLFFSRPFGVLCLAQSIQACHDGKLSAGRRSSGG